MTPVRAMGRGATTASRWSLVAERVAGQYEGDLDGAIRLPTMTVFGVHAGLQHTTRRRAAQRRGGASRTSGSGGSRSGTTSTAPPASPTTPQCLEAVAMHAALACSTIEGARAARSCTRSATATQPCWPRRSPPSTSCRAAAPTWASVPAGPRSSTTRTASRSPTSKTRMDQLEEGIQCLRGLLHDDVTTFEGKYFSLDRGPQRAAAGAGEAADLDRRRRREAHAARSPRSTPTAGTSRSSRPTVRPQERRARPSTAPTVGRDPSDISAPSTSASRSPRRACSAQFGAIADYVRPGVLSGSDEQIIDTHRPVRRGRRRPGEHRAARAVRPRVARTLQRRAAPDLTDRSHGRSHSSARRVGST